MGKIVSVRPTAIIHYSSAKRLHYSIFIRPNASSRFPLPAILFHTFIAAKSPPCLKGGRGDSVSLPRQYRVKGNVFRTPREGRPYGQTDKPHTVGRGLAPAEPL